MWGKFTPQAHGGFEIDVLVAKKVMEGRGDRDMKAGRELDALVAKEVLELDVEPSSNYDGWYGDLIPIGNREFIDPEGWVYDKGRKAVPHFSTNILCAWMIVERLCNWDVDDNMLILKGQGPEPEILDEEEDKGWWEAEINGIEGKFVAEADTPPLALCLVALKLKGIEVEDGDQ